MCLPMPFGVAIVNRNVTGIVFLLSRHCVCRPVVPRQTWLMCQGGTRPDEHIATAPHIKARQASTPHNAGLLNDNEAWLRTVAKYIIYRAADMAREEQIRVLQGKAN